MPTTPTIARSAVVTGGRDYANAHAVESYLDWIAPNRLYVGDANGADKLAREWAYKHSIPVFEFKAFWDAEGRAAGPKRNKRMLESAGHRALVIAFPGGKGTHNCVETARTLEMLVVRVEE